MNMKNHHVYISLGSNMGDQMANCLKGIRLLDVNGRIQILDQSSFYKTEPVDYTDQEWFVNGVIKIATSLEPFQLLAALKEIEQKVGRISNPIRFGPRVLDMDIIMYDSMVLNQMDLIIPHPRMHKRCFVLKPLCDIDPSIVHPGLNETVQNLLDNIQGEGQEVMLLQC